MDKTQKEKIREFIEDIDNYVDYHGEADKEDIEPYIRKESLINFINEQFDLAIKETEERIASSIRMAECSHDSNSHCMEEMCWIHQEGGYNEAVRDIINLIRNK